MATLTPLELLSKLKARFLLIRLLNLLLFLFLPCSALFLLYSAYSWLPQIYLIPAFSLAALLILSLLQKLLKNLPRDQNQEVAKYLDQKLSAKERFISLLSTESNTTILRQLNSIIEKSELDSHFKLRIFKPTLIALALSIFCLTIGSYLFKPTELAQAIYLHSIKEGKKQAQELKEYLQQHPEIPANLKNKVEKLIKTLEQKGLYNEIALEQVEDAIKNNSEKPTPTPTPSPTPTPKSEQNQENKKNEVGLGESDKKEQSGSSKKESEQQSSTGEEKSDKKDSKGEKQESNSGSKGENSKEQQSKDSDSKQNSDQQKNTQEQNSSKQDSKNQESKSEQKESKQGQEDKKSEQQSSEQQNSKQEQETQKQEQNSQQQQQQQQQSQSQQQNSQSQKQGKAELGKKLEELKNKIENPGKEGKGKTEEKSEKESNKESEAKSNKESIDAKNPKPPKTGSSKRPKNEPSEQGPTKEGQDGAPISTAGARKDKIDLPKSDEKIVIRELGAKDRDKQDSTGPSESKTKIDSQDFTKPKAEIGILEQPIPLEYEDIIR